MPEQLLRAPKPNGTMCDSNATAFSKTIKRGSKWNHVTHYIKSRCTRTIILSRSQIVIMSNLVNFIFSRSRPSLIPVAIVNTIAGIDYLILRLHKLEGVVIGHYYQMLLFFSTEHVHYQQFMKIQIETKQMRKNTCMQDTFARATHSA